jgi:hypothetical protein
VSGSALPRRRFLQGLVAIPVLGRLATVAPQPPVVVPAHPGAVVEHRGWIVHERDRAALCAFAGATVMGMRDGLQAPGCGLWACQTTGASDPLPTPKLTPV